MMSSLAHATGLLGAILALLHLPMLAMPSLARKCIERFARNPWAARALTAVAVIWATRLLLATPMGRFDVYKPIVYVLAPVSFLLIVRFMDELLAPRALGGILLLVPAPLLAMARWHPSSWRYVIIVLAYVMVVAGVMLVTGPYHFRKTMRPAAASNGVCRGYGAAGLSLGLALVLLALTVY